MEFYYEAEGFKITYTSCGEVILPVKTWLKPLKPFTFKKTTEADKINRFCQLYPDMQVKDLKKLYKLSGQSGLDKLIDALYVEVIMLKLRESRLYSFSVEYEEQYSCFHSPRREFDIPGLTHDFILSKYGNFSVCVYRNNGNVIVADTTAIEPVVCCMDAIKAMHQDNFEPETLTKIARLTEKVSQ